MLSVSVNDNLLASVEVKKVQNFLKNSSVLAPTSRGQRLDFKTQASPKSLTTYKLQISEANNFFYS